MTKRKKIFISIGAVFLLFLSWTIWWNAHVTNSVETIVFDQVGDLEKRHVALLLGTSKYAKKGKINLYYQYRLDATAKLYKAGKIDYVLVSGDNSTIHYNEPTTMLKDLIAMGVPENCIIQDFAGFRTLDSMVRSKEVFGQQKVTVISQRFHVERALFLAKNKGIEAIGFCAQDVSKSYGFKTRVREYLARIKMFADLYILNKEPKFLGDPIEIPY